MNQQDYNWIELPPRYKWNSNSSDDIIQALGLPTVETLIEECNQFLAAGLIESSGKKMQEIFITILNESLSMKTNISSKKTEHQTLWYYGTIQSAEHPKLWNDSECRTLKRKIRKSCNSKH